MESFSDVVFAIVITLMAFDIKLSSSATSLQEAIHLLTPKLNGYVLSFLMVAIYWVAHHHIFHIFLRVNRQIIWLNLWFPLLVTFLPFSTSLLGAYSRDQMAVILYGANLASISLVLFAVWFYVTRTEGFVDSRLHKDARGVIDRLLLTMPVLATASIVISFFSVRYSLVVYYAIVIRFVMARRLDRRIEADLMQISRPDDKYT